MCGICGFINYSAPDLLKERIIKDMLSALKHRGPDDEGVLIDQNVVLGIKRLSIIDLVTGHQPIHNEDKSIYIIFNGEIYNFLELREYLENKGHLFSTQSDTEVIIHLYEEYGQDCLGKLNGMFVFCLWDKNRKLLFLARDRLGMKPLYYTQLNNCFIFASELKSILKFPKIKKELDLLSLDQYLTFEYIPSPRSIIRKVKKLPAGHKLIFKDEKIALTKYWDIRFSERCSDTKEDQAQEPLLDLLKKVINRHLISDVPLGVFLSGGIDSSTIVALMKNASARIKTFSIGFREESFDESRYFQKIAKTYQTEHHYRIFDARELLNLIPQAVNFLDEPLADGSFFPTYLLSKFSKEFITVALSGDGGDELFAGYPTYQAHKLAIYYKKIPSFLRRNFIEKMVLAMPVSMKNFSLDFKAKKFISGLNYPVLFRHIFWMGSFNPQEKSRLFSPELKAALEDKDTVQAIIDNYFKDSGRDEKLDKLQYWDMKTYLQDDLLVKTDRASMANSLEVRIPYLDYELVEFVCGLPEKLRLRNFNTKYILKKTMKEFIPRDIVYRKKKGFGIPVAFWIKKEFKQLISEVLNKDKIEKEGLFNSRYVQELLEQHFRNRIDNRKKIWTLFMFELWLKECFCV